VEQQNRACCRSRATKSRRRNQARYSINLLF